ncbi:uncharacterized protein LOC126375577 [Pectinophora gossypiella]|uniref:uncharacterized protein LOC126375577 n=1 Tax=Pectinophora gossypiella TaxID=13191 RepID=UPI00214EB016|nr:uncharacterized protein LOC126375577 [Pectinophora gossypiella]
MSAVWKFFKKKDNQEPVTCNLCNKSYKTCGNTTNLATHLKVKHHFAYLQLLNMQKSTKSGNENEPEPEDAMSVDNENSSNSVDVVPSTSTKEMTDYLASTESETQFSIKKRKQPTLLNVLGRGLSLEEGRQKHSELTQALINMICKDNLALSCVEKKGLQKFCRTACPLYKLPCRKKVTQLIKNRCDILTITNSTRSFLVVTVHFIDTLNGSPVLQNINL